MPLTHKTKSIRAYHYALHSSISRQKIKVDAIIFAESFGDADQLFYSKILSEFSPQEYAHIIRKATYDGCIEEDLPPEESIFARRGIIFFRATSNDVEIRSLALPRPWSVETNWHNGLCLSQYLQLVMPFIGIAIAALSLLFIYLTGS